MLFKPVSDNFSGFLFTKKKKKRFFKTNTDVHRVQPWTGKGTAPVAVGSGIIFSL